VLVVVRRRLCALLHPGAGHGTLVRTGNIVEKLSFNFFSLVIICFFKKSATELRISSIYWGIQSNILFRRYHNTLLPILICHPIELNIKKKTRPAIP